MSDSHPSHPTAESEPRLRHEFVGMMFAVTIGEVGLQGAGLVQAGQPMHFLPAYGHLLLATMVVATSWVGWSASVAPGARKDVDHVFQWEFLVLVLDVFLVVVYFIIVRTIDFAKEGSPRIDSPSTVAGWVVLVFILYLAWDFLTKVLISWRDRDTPNKKLGEHFNGSWLRLTGSRMVPTLVCFVLALSTWRCARNADRPHYLTADFSMLWLVLLFRVLKELVSAYFPSPAGRHIPKPGMSKKSAVGWTIVCGLLLSVGLAWTAFSWPLPLPARIVAAIRNGP